MATYFNIRNALIAVAASWGGIWTCQHIREHANDESGTIVDKSNYELKVDIDGDNRADCVIQFCEGFYGDAFYHYANVGDKISYSNTWHRDTLSDVGISCNQIRQINGKSAKAIMAWDEILKQAKMRRR